MTALPTLTDGVIALRPWALDDAADLTREIQDADVVRWLNITLPYTTDDARLFIAAADERWQERGGAHFAITSPATGAFLGYLGALDAERRMSVVEIVYWVAAPARGNGVATAALKLVLPWIQEEIAPERIELGMVAGNDASARVAERNGFVLREIVPDAATLDGGAADERIYEFGLLTTDD
ncbi:MAG: GNAT family N-acetyltransferase [Acidimicrobiia bacterium]|nr:GNAT family N-acetyltransferase [Acidimicrobiia bacterium]